MNGLTDRTETQSDTEPLSHQADAAVAPDSARHTHYDPGSPPAPSIRGHRKSPVLACLLSLLPGVGQVYVGYYKLGFVHNIVFASIIMVLSFLQMEALVPLLGIFLAFFYVYNIVDAGRRAAFYNLALDGITGVVVPDDMNAQLPSFGGSLVGGLLLIGLGGVLLSNTLFGRTLDWIENWWPVAPIILGVYLFVRAVRDRRQDGESDPETPPSA